MTAVIALLGGIRATVFAGTALLALLLAGVQTWRLDSAQDAIADMSLQVAKDQAALAAAQVEASESARLDEQNKAAAVNEAAAAYERGKVDAQALARRTADNLRTGNARLRDEIAALAARGMPGCPAATSESESAAQRGAELVGAAIAVGRTCDARVNELVNAYEAIR